MSQTPIFHTPHQAITVMFGMQARLGLLVMWMLLACAHLCAAVIALGLLWAYQVTPQAAWAACQQLIQSSAVGALAAIGFSLLSLVAGYLWLLRWVHRKMGKGWLVTYLLKGSDA